MIQEAHVGIGIRGLEGTQASQVSDYSITKFKYLKRLLAVHGHYNMNRMALLIKYSLYKNVCFSTPIFIFLFYCFFSQQLVYEDWFATFYNTIITALPPIYFAIFEKDTPDWVLERYPQIYSVFKAGGALDFFSICKWFILAVYHGVSL